MKITIDKKENISILRVSGSLDAETVASFKKKAMVILEQGCNQIVLDFAKLDFIDSMGLGAMISLLRRVRTNRGDLKVAALNKEVMSVFEITRLHHLFEIFPNWEAACSKFS